jgi:hypothetical protein
MSMTTEILGQVGPQVLSDGANATFRQDRSGAQIIQQLHGRYYETSLRRALFSGSITGQVTTVGTSTTYTGLCVSNPVGSPVNLVLNKVGYAFIVAFPAGSVVGLMTGYSAGTNVTHTTPVTPRSQFFNGAGGGVGLLDSSATLPAAPTVNMILASGLTGAITTVPFISGLVDLEGSIILPPGAYCAIYTSTITGAAAGAFSFQWEEIPV